MPPTQTHNVNVSLETFNEIANALEAAGVKINADAPISITKDIKIKGPVDYRQVQIRRDVMQEVVKVYEPPMNEDGSVCLTDSSHFINFLDDVYSYILKGEKPKATPTTVAPIKTTPKKTGW